MLDLVQPCLKLEKISSERLDGSKSITQRKAALKRFSTDKDCTVLLASIDCAGVGSIFPFPLFLTSI